MKTIPSTPPRSRASTGWPSPISAPANTTTTRFTVQAVPGHELGLRVEYDTEVFDTASIEALIERFERVLEAMTADPGRRVASIDVLDAQSTPGWMRSGTGRC